MAPGNVLLIIGLQVNVTLNELDCHLEHSYDAFEDLSLYILNSCRSFWLVRWLPITHWGIVKLPLSSLGPTTATAVFPKDSSPTPNYLSIYRLYLRLCSVSKRCLHTGIAAALRCCLASLLPLPAAGCCTTIMNPVSRASSGLLSSKLLLFNLFRNWFSPFFGVFFLGFIFMGLELQNTDYLV